MHNGYTGSCAAPGDRGSCRRAAEQSLAYPRCLTEWAKKKVGEQTTGDYRHTLVASAEVSAVALDRARSIWGSRRDGRGENATQDAPDEERPCDDKGPNVLRRLVGPQVI